MESPPPPPVRINNHIAQKEKQHGTTIQQHQQQQPVVKSGDNRAAVKSPNMVKDANQKPKEGFASVTNHVKVKEDGKIKDGKHKEHKHKSDKHHHKDGEKHKHHKDDKKHRSPEDKMKSKHKDSKDKHKDVLTSGDKHLEHKHKDVHNSSSKPKEAHQSSSSAPKLKENHISHKDPSKVNHVGSHKITEDGKLKEKINNSNSIIKPKVSKPSGQEPKVSKDPSAKPKENNLVPSKTSEEKKHHHHHHHHQVDKHKLASSQHKPNQEMVKKHKDIHKTDDQKSKVEKKHKENREKLKEHKEGKEQKTSQHSGHAQPNKVKTEPFSPVKSPVSSPTKLPVTSPTKPKEELMSDDDVPLGVKNKLQRHMKVKQEPPKNMKRLIIDDDDIPLASRMPSGPKKIKRESAPKKRRLDDSDDDYQRKRVKVETKTSPKKKKKEEEEQNVWKWWEEEKCSDGKKWKTLEHNGVVFAPLYEPLPNSVTFLYDGKPMKLSPGAEEVASFYARMLDHDYTTKEAFNKNFFKGWRKSMNEKEKPVITDLKKCNFNNMHQYFLAKSEERKSMTKEQKAEIKKNNEEITKQYGFCIIDGHKEKIGNFKIEPPGLFRGRGEHPKMGTLKLRIMPEDVIINCGKHGKIPQAPSGHRWKEVRHDNQVTWLASWTENVQGQTKYVMLNASSKLKGEKDWQKYEVARRLKSKVVNIRAQYRLDWKSKEMRIRQRAVALYFIDKLALRAGNEKEEGETADTVGCCSLRVEHIQLCEKDKSGKEFVVEFDFLGKDSIRYQNSVCVEKRVFKNLKIFMEGKKPEDDLFDRLNTSILNKHLTELMDGLTAKVFRTFNASKTLQEQLDLLTKSEYSIAEKILAYNRANRAVAILCNHQRSVPKTHGKSMETLQAKIKAKEEAVSDAKREVKQMRRSRDSRNVDKKEKALERLEEQLKKLEVQATDKEENKDIALGTSKLNYLDPRISVAWCKKWEVPIEKIYSKTHREKFRWAIDMATSDFKF